MGRVLFGGAVVLALGGFGAAMAQEAVTGDAAAAGLYDAKAAEVEMADKDLLPKDQSKVLKMVARDQPYYAAIAISPDEGLMSEATVALANFHTVEAASTAALAECNARKTGASDCVIVAVVRPEGWVAGRLQLSSDATAGFTAGYDGGALAVSDATGSWGIGADDAAALAACAERNAAAADCAVVIRN